MDREIVIVAPGIGRLMTLIRSKRPKKQHPSG
jgi:hypothetical protein